jgi:hypothetical protein
MRKKLLILFFASLSLGAPAVHAATVELMPLVGWEIHGSRDLAGPRNDRMDLKNVALRGLTGAYLMDAGQIELSWTRAYSAAQIQQSEGRPADQFDVRVDQFLFDGLYLFEQQGPLQPFFLLGFGATHYSPSNTRSASLKPSAALGTGVKWLWNDYIGLRFDARWTPTLAPNGSHFFCDQNGQDCYSVENNYSFSQNLFLNNLQFTSGLLLRY